MLKREIVVMCIYQKTSALICVQRDYTICNKVLTRLARHTNLYFKYMNGLEVLSGELLC